MNRFKLILIIALVAGSCSRMYKVTTDSMSNTFNPGQVLTLSKKASIDRGDIVFFRKNSNSGKDGETWLFRVVAFSGDTIEIKNGNVTVNNNIMELPESARLLYSITASKPMDVKAFRENTVKQVSDNMYIGYLTRKEYTEVSGGSDLTISRLISSPGKSAKGIVRNDFTDNWNEDQFGPLYIPKTGQIIKINKANKDLYSDILLYLQTDSTITIREKLYFMLGDNRGDAFDSRFTGFVTESNIIGCVE